MSPCLVSKTALGVQSSAAAASPFSHGHFDFFFFLPDGSSCETLIAGSI